MFLSTAVKYFWLSLHMTKLNILSAMEYRLNFFIQVTTMLIHQLSYLLLWLIFFTQFPSVHGWEFQDTALLLAITSINFGMIAIFTGGIFDIARIIQHGELDYYLAFPAPVLWHILGKKTFIASIGEIIFGVVMYFYSGDLSLYKTGFFLIICLLTSIITFNFIVIIQSAAFYLRNLEEAATQFVDALTDFVFYPQTIFSGALKFITIFISPAYFIGTVPITLLKQFNGTMFALLIAFAVLSTFLAQFVFSYGLQRYKMGLMK